MQNPRLKVTVAEIVQETPVVKSFKLVGARGSFRVSQAVRILRRILP